MPRRRVLYAGCGWDHLPPFFGDDAEEVRLDIDPGMDPDIVASILDLGEIGPYDAVYSFHTLEHVYPHEVGTALREFRRVLTEDGFALIVVPDLEDLTITDKVLYDSPAGPITALSMFYGHGPMIEYSIHMAHHTGFTSKLLHDALIEAGFTAVIVKRVDFNIMAVATR